MTSRHKKKNIAIIPARCGSKGLKYKNIKELNGKPLLAYSVDTAVDSGLFDEVMVSTDSNEYAGIARKCGASVPFLRSNEQSGDDADSWGVVLEVLAKYMENGQYFDTVCLLQPTSPLRKTEDILAAYELMHDKNADAVTSVCEVDHSPLWTMMLDEDQSLFEFRKNLVNVPRQKLSKYFRLNGAIYIKRICYGENITLLDEKEYAVIMDQRNSVDIDTIEDFELAEWYLNSKRRE